MGDLVLPRELIGGDTVFGHDGENENAVAQACLGCLFEGITSRQSTPYKPIDISPPFSLLGVKKIHSLLMPGTDAPQFSERYAARLDRPVRFGFFAPTDVGRTLRYRRRVSIVRHAIPTYRCRPNLNVTPKCSH